MQQRRRVREVAVLEGEARVAHVPVLGHVLDAPRVEGGGAAHHAVHAVALGQQQLHQVGAVLPRDARYQRGFAARRACSDRPLVDENGHVQGGPARRGEKREGVVLAFMQCTNITDDQSYAHFKQAVGNDQQK